MVPSYCCTVAQCNEATQLDYVPCIVSCSSSRTAGSHSVHSTQSLSSSSPLLLHLSQPVCLLYACGTHLLYLCLRLLYSIAPPSHLRYSLAHDTSPPPSTLHSALHIQILPASQMGNTPAAARTALSAPLTSALRPQQGARTSALSYFDLTDVQLTSGSRVYAAFLLNAQYLLTLDVDRLLYSFRTVAGVDTRGAQPYGGWESPDYVCHGHFVGHALMSYAWLSRQLQVTEPDMAASCLSKSNALVAGYTECQLAYNSEPFGYFGSVGTDTFDRLEALADEGLQDAPYYLVHKNLAGLLAAYRYTANDTALATASSLGDYFHWRTGRLTQRNIDAMLNTRRYTGEHSAFFMEHGGILDGFIELYRLTANPNHLTLLRHFDRAWFRDMLVSGEDRLAENGEHANADLQPVTGLANMYSLTNDLRYRSAVLNFLGWMQTGHEFITGNVSGKSAYPQPLDYGSELFNSPMLLQRQVNSTPGHLPFDNYPGAGPGSGESCCAHNLNKSTMYALAWTGDARWGDEFEKRFVNCVLAQQHPTTGMLLYNLSLHQGCQKGFGDREYSFWCCYGSGVEAFASLTNGAFLNDGKNGLWINNFIPSTVQWTAQGLSMQLDSNFPDDANLKATFKLERAVDLAVYLRIPYWAVTPITISINGVEQPQIARAPGSFAVIERQWQDADVLEVALPFSLYSEVLPDNPAYVGVKFGPHALVTCAPPDSVFDGTASQLIDALKPAGPSAPPCNFTLSLQGPVRPLTATVKPVYQVVDEWYNGYTIITQPPAEVALDAVQVGDAVSEAAHGLQSDNSSVGYSRSLTYRDAQYDGFISYTLKVDSSKQCYLRVLYDGDMTSDANLSRVFDIQILLPDGSYRTFATQSLDTEAPSAWYTVLYPLPAALTYDRSTLTFRFQAKGFNGKAGAVGPVYDQVSTLTLADKAAAAECLDEWVV